MAAPPGAANPGTRTERWRQVLALGEATIGGRIVVAVGGRHILLPPQFRPVLEHLVQDNPPVERDATLVSLRKVLALGEAPPLADLLLRLRREDSRIEVAWRNWWRGFITIPLWRPPVALVSALRGRVLTPNLLSVWAIATLLAIVSLGAQPLPAVQGLSGWQWPVFWVMITLTTVVHELGHLLAAAHFGVRARSVGVGLLYIQPAAYTDVTNSWLVRRDARIAIALGGMLTQSVPVLAGYVAWRLTGSSLLGWYVLANVGFMAFNLLPFVRLDGYWILCFALDEFNLRSRAFAQCLHVVLGDRVPGSWTGSRAVLGALYGALSALFTAGMYVSAVAWVQSVVPARTSPYVPFAAWGAVAVTVAIATIRRRLRRNRRSRTP